jgi:hypothetical protein
VRLNGREDLLGHSDGDPASKRYQWSHEVHPIVARIIAIPRRADSARLTWSQTR